MRSTLRMTTPANPSDDQWLDLHAAANRARCHEATLRRLIRRGVLRHARLGKLIRVRASWVDAAMIAAATPVEK
jgi:excisionase family DNA binding protein